MDSINMGNLSYNKLIAMILTKEPNFPKGQQLIIRESLQEMNINVSPIKLSDEHISESLADLAIEKWKKRKQMNDDLQRIFEA